MSEKPKGKLFIVGVEQYREPTNLTIFAKVIVEDEVGNKFVFKASGFSFDLKPIDSEKYEPVLRS